MQNRCIYQPVSQNADASKEEEEEEEEEGEEEAPKSPPRSLQRPKCVELSHCYLFEPLTGVVIMNRRTLAEQIGKPRFRCVFLSQDGRVIFSCFVLAVGDKSEKARPKAGRSAIRSPKSVAKHKKKATVSLYFPFCAGRLLAL